MRGDVYERSEAEKIFKLMEQEFLKVISSCDLTEANHYSEYNPIFAASATSLSEFDSKP
jgi:hypothetical protein